MRRMRDHLSFANVMSVAAVFIALGGTAIGINKIKANSVGSKQIKTGAVQTADLADNSVTSPKVANGSLLGEDFKAGEMPAGAPGVAGPQGPQGPEGAKGDQGIQGPAGSPDTGAQILTKLAPVDGNGSGLDADRLDGLTSTDFTDNFALKVADSVHVVGGGAGQPPFLNGFSSAAGHGPAAFFRDGFGVVHLQGNVKLPTAVFVNGPFVLPAGYRPADGRLFVAWRFAPGSAPRTPVGIAVTTAGEVFLLDPGGGDPFAMDDEVYLDGVTFRCSPPGANGCP